MVSITLKDIPEHLHRHWKQRAKQHNRSLQSEIIHGLSMLSRQTENKEQVLQRCRKRQDEMAKRQKELGLMSWTREEIDEAKREGRR